MHWARGEIAVLRQNWTEAQQEIDQADCIACHNEHHARLFQLRACVSRVRLAKSRLDLPEEEEEESARRLEVVMQRLRAIHDTFPRRWGYQDLRDASAYLDPLDQGPK